MRFTLFLRLTFAISCTHHVDKATNVEKKSAPSIADLFLSLPDETFPINEIYPTLTKVERQTILNSSTHERATALDADFVMTDDYGRSDSFLAFRYRTSDDGILVQLKTW